MKGVCYGRVNGRRREEEREENKEDTMRERERKTRTSKNIEQEKKGIK